MASQAYADQTFHVQSATRHTLHQQAHTRLTQLHFNESRRTGLPLVDVAQQEGVWLGGCNEPIQVGRVPALHVLVHACLVLINGFVRLLHAIDPGLAQAHPLQLTSEVRDLLLSHTAIPVCTLQQLVVQDVAHDCHICLASVGP